MQKKLITPSKLIVLIILILIFSKVMAYEEPKYTVINKNEVYEIRHYKERLAVQVTYSYDSSGFRKLFNYISGSNTQSKKVKMTTPVTESTKIAMTIPVTQTEENITHFSKIISLPNVSFFGDLEPKLLFKDCKTFNNKRITNAK